MVIVTRVTDEWVPDVRFQRTQDKISDDSKLEALATRRIQQSSNEMRQTQALTDMEKLQEEQVEKVVYIISSVGHVKLEMFCRLLDMQAWSS